MDDYLRANREHWNGLVPIHARLDFYDVEGFKTGKSTLTSIESAEFGRRRGQVASAPR